MPFQQVTFGMYVFFPSSQERIEKNINWIGKYNVMLTKGRSFVKNFIENKFVSFSIERYAIIINIIINSKNMTHIKKRIRCK